MKPAKPASATMNEQTFVPATMRAVYYDQIRTGDEVLAGANYTKKYREINAGLAIGAFLDGILQRRGQDHTIPGGPKFKIGDVVLGMLSYTRDGGAADYALATEDEAR
ncbi:hypothetical protein N7497_012305 [Penicillium chrysogenum]|nr:hypothetical protein N7497_012305 [Penicillium chrysogenum]